ncbi:MAG: DUF4388 domain-containing protein [Chloroflexota bacterium]|nr:DUF4388 domain-containing protein [Chloroflexota bacterium]MDQ3513282.1 DUF4388 domain-containing protein [Chloroflexota bacterium]
MTGVMGGLGDFDVAGILQLLTFRRATGQLIITAENDQVSLTLDKGKLIQVSSIRLPLRLGRILLRRGLITTEQVQQALYDQEHGPERRSLGAILVDRGWLSLHDLTRCIEEQCISALARVIAADTGTFAYSPRAGVATSPDQVPLNAERILLEATRRVDELSELRVLLPKMNAPIALYQGSDGLPVSDPDAQRILAALRIGIGSLGELIDILPIDELVLLRAVIRLREMGLIAVGDDARPDLGGVPPSEDDLSRLFEAVSGTTPPAQHRPTPTPPAAHLPAVRPEPAASVRQTA